MRVAPLFLILLTLAPAVHAAQPMEQAAERGDVAALRSQLSTGVDINQRYDIGRSALLIAARYGQLAAVEALAQSGANLNLQDNNGDTALHLAAAYSHLPVVQFLQKNGADTQLRNRGGYNVLSYVEQLAADQGDDASLQPMVAYLAKSTAAARQHAQCTDGNDSTKCTVPKQIAMNVKNYAVTPKVFYEAAYRALLKRGWQVESNHQTRLVGKISKAEYGTVYKVEIKYATDIVTVGFVEGYHNPSKRSWLKNLASDIKQEIQPLKWKALVVPPAPAPAPNP